MAYFKILFFALLGIIAIAALVFGPRLYKGIQLKQDKVQTYAIQNVATSMCIRPYNADFKDDNKVILYEHKNWECITWQFIEIEKDTFLLKNLYTEKTFQPMANPTDGVTMWQKPLGGSALQYWEFLKQDDGSYYIRLKGTDLYLTAASKEQNADIALKPMRNEISQQWKLIEQHPIV